MPLPIAGENHTLSCFAITEDHLVVVPALKWIAIEGIPEISETNHMNNSTSDSESVLTFNPLRTSHGGSYTCETRIDIPQAGISDLTSSTSENVTVQSKSL